MAATKIYLKKGNLNYKERKLIQAIEKAIEEKGLNLRPANNFAELQGLYDTHVGEVVEFTEMPKDSSGKKPASAEGNEGTSNEESHKAFRESAKESVQKPADSAIVDVIDPFNSEEPLVRDYVLDGGFKDPNDSQQPTKTVFEEPQSFDSSFKMPDDDDDKKSSGGGNKGGGGFGGSDKKKSEPKNEKAPPLNPNFDDMSTAKKKKSTKKMAKAIVEGVCKLAEFGCVWWVTKDITADKVAQYEIEDTIDLQMLLSLDENQQVTVKDWFAIQVKNANDLLKITQPEKDELAESLYEVMLEKGIAPTPMQELIINAVSTIIIGLGVKAFAMQQQISGVLGQLMTVRAEQKQAESNAERRHQESMAAERMAHTAEHTHTHTETTTKTDTDTDLGGEGKSVFDEDDHFTANQETGLTVVDGN
jgi:hypothetical protein